MKSSQQKYLEGVSNLNNVRGSSFRINLETLEGSVDYLKRQWFLTFKDVQDIEKKEKAQLQRVIEAESKLKAFEQLEVNHQSEFNQSLAKMEQKSLDEFAISKTQKSN
jgi:flagellar biosynthesis chaperone FliJ